MDLFYIPLLRAQLNKNINELLDDYSNHFATQLYLTVVVSFFDCLSLCSSFPSIDSKLFIIRAMFGIYGTWLYCITFEKFPLCSCKPQDAETYLFLKIFPCVVRIATTCQRIICFIFFSRKPSTQVLVFCCFNSWFPPLFPGLLW